MVLTSGSRIGFLTHSAPPALPRPPLDPEATDALQAEWESHRFLKKNGFHALLLKQPYWYRLVGQDRRTADDKAQAEMSPAARRAQRRNERKLSKQRKYAAHGPAQFTALLAA